MTDERPSCIPQGAALFVFASDFLTSQLFCGTVETEGRSHMAVKRIVMDIATGAPAELQQFYVDLFDLSPVMDQGWIITLASERTAPVQISFASEGGSGAPVPDASIEVDDIEETYARAKAMGCQITYDLVDEPWGVRRFFVRDPAGKVLNILAHNS